VRAARLARTAALVLLLVGCADVAPAAESDAGERPSDAATPHDAQGPISEDAAAIAPDAPPIADAGELPEPDAGAAPGGPGCVDRDAIFCEDFEADGPLDRTRWDIDLREGARIDVSSAMAAEGARAVRLRVPPTAGARAFLAPLGVLPLTPNRFHVRFYLSTVPAVETNHAALVHAYDETGRTYYGLHSNSGRLNSRYNAPDVTEHGGLRYIGGQRLPVGEWVCVELLFDGDADAIRVWFDGEEDEAMRVDATTDPPWPAPVFQRMHLGMHTYQAASASFDVWYDAIVIDDERIGCD
jgi:hypothetical protein